MITIAVIGGGSGGASAANHIAYKLKNEIKEGKVKQKNFRSYTSLVLNLCLIDLACIDKCGSVLSDIF